MEVLYGEPRDTALIGTGFRKGVSVEPSDFALTERQSTAERLLSGRLRGRLNDHLAGAKLPRPTER